MKKKKTKYYLNVVATSVFLKDTCAALNLILLILKAPPTLDDN